MAYIKRGYFWLGPCAGVVAYMASGGLVSVGLLFWMATWWLVEAVPLAVTALLPIIVFTLSKTLSFKELSQNYSAEVIFLFLGGFMLAAAVEKWGLQRWLAAMVLKFSGTRPDKVLFAFMAVTAFTSIWISNSAAALMMLPLARVVTANRLDCDGFNRRLLLGIAYAASIGGAGAIIGSPPNAIFAAYSASAGQPVSFLKWMSYGVPFAIVGLFVAWFYFLHFGGRLHLDQPVKLPNMDGDEKLNVAQKQVLVVFTLAAVSWIMNGLLPQSIRVPDALVGLVAGIVLFTLPSRSVVHPGARLLESKDFDALPWGVLLLFGGGMALAMGLQAEGVTDSLSKYILGVSYLPPFVFTIIYITFVMTLTTFASNTAVAALIVPLLGGLTGGTTQLNGLHLGAGAAVASSMAFILPVSTPPNAIVYSTGLVKMRDMVRAGMGLSAIFIVLLTLLVMFWLPVVL